MSAILECAWFPTGAFTLWQLLLAVVILLLYGSRLKLWWRYKRLPPGPFCWPLLGYLPFYNRETSYIKLKEEAAKYGGLFSIFVGSQYVIVIDDFKILKAAYSQKEFLGRPTRLFQINEHMEQITLIAANGTVWKKQRRFLMNCFRVLGLGTDDFRSITMAEISDVISSLKKKENQEVNVDDQVQLALNNVTFQILFNKRFDHHHPLIKLLGVYDHVLKTYMNFNGLHVFLPWLGFLVKYLTQYKKCLQIMEKMDRFIGQEVSEHQQSRDANEPRDFLDLYLSQMDKPGLQEEFNTETLIGNIKLQLISSSESTRDTLVWFLLLMAEHPNIQKHIQKQMDTEVGREREPLLADKARLPLLEAAILESMRFKNLLHLDIPRLVLEDTTLCGYDIPKDTIIFFNMTSHFKSPVYWTDPDRFDPNRFLSQDKTKIHVPEHFIPFSYGKRSCPGEKIALSNLFLFAAFLLQKFTILPPDGGIKLDMKVNVSNDPAHPFARFKSRD